MSNPLHLAHKIFVWLLEIGLADLGFSFTVVLLWSAISLIIAPIQTLAAQSICTVDAVVDGSLPHN